MVVILRDVLYTRDGSFSIDLNGEIATSEGHKVMSANGMSITVPMRAAGIVTKMVSNGLARLALTSVGIQPDGTVEATYGGTNIVAVAKIGLATLPMRTV